MSLTLILTKEKVIDLILSRFNRKTYEDMDDKTLLTLLKELGYGENKNLPYYNCEIKISKNDNGHI